MILINIAKLPSIEVYHFAPLPALPTEYVVQFWTFAVLIGKKLYLNVVLNVIYLIMREVYHLLICVRPSAFPNKNSSFL